MVSDSVKVYTRSWQKEGEGFCWESDGSGVIQSISPRDSDAELKIVIQLKDDFRRVCQRRSNQGYC